MFTFPTVKAFRRGAFGFPGGVKKRKFPVLRFVEKWQGLSLLTLVCLLGTVDLMAQVSKVDLNGAWQSGDSIYHVTQVGDTLKSQGAYGPATGAFTGPFNIVMKWATATWTGLANSDEIRWSNNSLWVRQGSTKILADELAVPAGQADGQNYPDCPPAKCGTLAVRHVPPAGPSGEARILRITAEYISDHGWGYCKDETYQIQGNPAKPDYGCDHWFAFDNYQIKREADGNGWIVSFRVKNWASYSQTGKLIIDCWAYNK